MSSVINLSVVEPGYASDILLTETTSGTNNKVLDSAMTFINAVSLSWALVFDDLWIHYSVQSPIPSTLLKSPRKWGCLYDHVCLSVGQ